MTQSSVPDHPRRYISPLTRDFDPARVGRCVSRPRLPGKHPTDLPGGTLTDEQVHFVNPFPRRNPAAPLTCRNRLTAMFFTRPPETAPATTCGTMRWLLAVRKQM